MVILAFLERSNCPESGRKLTYDPLNPLIIISHRAYSYPNHSWTSKWIYFVRTAIRSIEVMLAGVSHENTPIFSPQLGKECSISHARIKYRKLRVGFCVYVIIDMKQAGGWREEAIAAAMSGGYRWKPLIKKKLSERWTDNGAHCFPCMINDFAELSYRVVALWVGNVGSKKVIFQSGWI